jgi:hypothetical protein
MDLKDFALAGVVAFVLIALGRVLQVVIAWISRPKTDEAKTRAELEAMMKLPPKPEITDPEVLKQNHEFLMQDAQERVEKATKTELSRSPEEIESEFHKNFGGEKEEP